MLAGSFLIPVAEYRAKEMGWNPDQQPFAAALRCVFLESKMRAAFWGTLKISLLTVITGSVWGAGLALLWWRRDFPGRRFFSALGYAPILMPPLVGTLAFFQLIGEGGYVWRIFSAHGKPWADGFTQVVILHSYAFGVYSYAYVAAAFEHFDASREEAARSLGAGTFQTLRSALWPVIRPPLYASAIVTFMAAASSFSAPYFLDNSSRYLTVEIVNEQGDPGMQRAISSVLACLSLAALPAFLYFSGKRQMFIGMALNKGAGNMALRPARGIDSFVRIVLSIGATILLLAPPAMVLIGAFEFSHGTNTKTGVLAGLTEDDWSALARSGWYGGVAAIIDVFLAITIALSLRRASFLATLPVELSVMLALALPGSAVAVALMSAFNAPSPLTGGLALGHTGIILILAYVIRTLPLAVRPARAALEAAGTDLEDAAAGLGAGRGLVLGRVTLPLMMPSISAAALICFITSAGEYVSSRLLFSALTVPASVRIEESFRTDPAAAYALAVCLMVLSAVAVGAARFFRGRT